MADFVFNAAKGRFVEKLADDATLIGVLLLKAAEADTALKDHDDINSLIAAVGNTEADFTNYERKEPATGIVITIDNANDRVDVDMSDLTWATAGGASNNTLTDLVTYYYETGTGTDIGAVPLTNHDFAVTTDGSTLTAQVNAAGFARAQDG